MASERAAKRKEGVISKTVGGGWEVRGVKGYVELNDGRGLGVEEEEKVVEG